MIDIELDIAGKEELIAELSATQKQVEMALRSTVRQLSGWLKTKAMRGLSKELGIAVGILRRRLKALKLRTSSDGSSMVLWFGLNPIGLIWLGAKKTKAGVAAGKRKIPGAFIAKGQVFKRVGKSRLPIEKQSLEVEDQAHIYLEDELLGSAEIERRFSQIFERELSWRTTTK